MHAAATAISGLTEAGAAEAAIEIAREAIGLLNQAFGYVNDSSGVTGDAAQELLSVHLDACLAAPPEPESLADYLASLLLHYDEGLDPGLDGYADLLGEAGFSRLRERISAAFTADPQAWRPKWLLETVLKAEGDVDGSSLSTRRILTSVAGTTCASPRNLTGPAVLAKRSGGPSAVYVRASIRTRG